ncbi:uromodulin-like [Pocillopora verrucosa]|uniref:uromodulin-like n=1 Tax=Pocillopora verrucosa TaxID=203993 RepID=UPI00333EEC9B
MYWLFRNLRFLFLASTMEFVTANDQCRTEVNIQGMALKRSVFKRWSVATPHLCDVKCGLEIACQSYNYNLKYQICELNNRTKEARPENFLSAPGWFYIRRLNGRAPLGSIPELPAISCLEIKASEGKNTISGKYWLDPAGTGKAILINCDMASGDMDECKYNISDCDVNANCTNTYVSYKCTCKAGYTGDGHSCSDIDECSNGDHACDENANCTNTKGSYLCNCKEGYAGNGESCQDVDECKGNHSCHVDATCMNTNGSYHCDCHPGYTGNGQNCTADPCYNYQNLSDANRRSNYDTPLSGPAFCDSQLSDGWYRFVGAAGTRMPTTRVLPYKCDTDWSGWLDGAHPTMEDGEVYRKVCFSDRHSGCKFVTNISVKNCGSYFIYNLPPSSACNTRYCATN